MSQTVSIKDESRKLIDQSPDDCTWDDALYGIYVRQTIEAGLSDISEGKTISHGEVRREFGLDS